MNYRHGFHAGNAVDVVKHVVLVALLMALQRKPAPYAYLETHAGRGRYSLEAHAATRTGEADDGIQRLRARRAALLGTAGGTTGGSNGAITRYLELVDAENPGCAPTAAVPHYPGSPAIALALARDGDRAVLCELQAEEAALLRRTFGDRSGVEVRAVDGWRELSALLPPRERRGVVLIDPPYEVAEDWKHAADSMRTALGRWPSGIVALWYPHKATAEAAGLEHRVRGTVQTKVLRVAFWSRADGPGLLGCGVLIANPPFGLAEQLTTESTALAQVLAGERGRATVDWLVPERD